MGQDLVFLIFQPQSSQGLFAMLSNIFTVFETSQEDLAMVQKAYIRMQGWEKWARDELVSQTIFYMIYTVTGRRPNSSHGF